MRWARGTAPRVVRGPAIFDRSNVPAQMHTTTALGRRSRGARDPIRAAPGPSVPRCLSRRRPRSQRPDSVAVRPLKVGHVACYSPPSGPGYAAQATLGCCRRFDFEEIKQLVIRVPRPGQHAGRLCRPDDRLLVLDFQAGTRRRSSRSIAAMGRSPDGCVSGSSRIPTTATRPSRRR